MLVIIGILIMLAFVLLTPEDFEDGFKSSFIYQAYEMATNPSLPFKGNRVRFIAKTVLSFILLFTLLIYIIR